MFMAQSKGVVSSLNSKHKAFLKTRQVFFWDYSWQDNGAM